MLNHKQAEKKSSQFNAVLNDVLLLFYDLVLLWVVCLGYSNTGRDGRIQRADAVPTSRQLLWELQLGPLAIRRMLLTCKPNAQE